MLTAATTATFTITDGKIYGPIVTLWSEDNVKLSKLLSERSIYWNEYKVIPNKIVEITDANGEKCIRELLDSSYQGVNNAAGNNQVSIDSHQKYFLPRFKIDNYNIEIDGIIFYDQPINDSIKKYDEIKKISTRKGDALYYWLFIRFCLFWKKIYRFIPVDLTKQKALHADSRAIQQIIFTGKIRAAVANTRVIIYYILEKSKETILECSKGTAEAF